MPYESTNHNKLTLAIHSTDDSFGFAYRENKNSLSENFFTKKFEKDLCNNLIVDFSNFITKENLKRINKISVSIGPSNFNASRQIIVLARTLAQQINCSLDSFSSFELMAKRIATQNNIYNDKNCDLSKIYYCCSKTSISFKQLVKKISNNKLTIPIPVYFIIIFLKIIEIIKIKLPLNLDNLYGLIVYNDEIEFENSDKYKILFRTL